MQTHDLTDLPAFERIRYRSKPHNKPDRAKPRSKRPWKLSQRRAARFVAFEV